MSSARSPSSQDSTGTGTSRCKAIAISTGQRCSRSGKLDGYCSEKHKQQAEATGNFWGHRADGGNPFSESEASEPEKAATKKAKATSATAKKTPASSKTAKVKAAVKSKLSSGAKGSEDDGDDVDFTGEDSDSVSVPAAKTPTPRPKKTTSATTKKSTPAKPKKKPARSGRKASQDSEDDFVPSEESDSDFEPEDIVESTDDDDDEVDDVDDLAESLKAVKIEKDDPSLPPRPLAPKKGTSPKKVKSNIQRQGSKIFNTTRFLAPPKKVIEEIEKAKKDPAASTTPASAPKKAKHRGFWIMAPPKVDIPESTIKVLSTVREKFDRNDSFGSTSSGSDSSTLTGNFKYHAYVPKFLLPQTDEDPDSTRAKLRHVAAKFWTKMIGKDDAGDGQKAKPAHEKDLPPIPASTPADSVDKKKKATQTKTSSASRQRRGSTASVDSVDSLTKDVKALTVRGDSSDNLDDVDGTLSNQCHGYNTSGQRCKRRVKVDGPIKKGMVLMCHDHEVDDEQAAVHIEGKGGVLLQWVDISVWVNPKLPDYIQIKLRRTMEKSISKGDKPGYIYAYHLKGASSDGKHTFFKVGRTDNVYRRMAQWSDQCGTPPRLLEVFPEQGSLAPRDDDDLDDDDEETAKKKGPGSDVVTGLRCRYAHRVEHLIHIELKPYHDKEHVCVCKTNHREWFKVPHKPGLSHSDQQKHAWQQVRRTIVHWMAYMDHVYGPG